IKEDYIDIFIGKTCVWQRATCVNGYQRFRIGACILAYNFWRNMHAVDFSMCQGEQFCFRRELLSITIAQVNWSVARKVQVDTFVDDIGGGEKLEGECAWNR